MFPLPKPYVFGKNEWKERDLCKEELMSKILEKSFLNEIGYTSLTDKKNKLLNKNSGFENTGELVKPLNNTKTEEEYLELFKRITSWRNIFEKLTKTVSNPVEKKKKEL